MKLSHLSDEALRASTKNAAQNERNATGVVLHHLREVDRRRLYSKWKYSDLKSYAVAELKYSDPEAWLRISAMQFLKALPEIESKVNDGSLSLSTLVLAKRAFANEAKLPLESAPQFELQAQSCSPEEVTSSSQESAPVKRARTKAEKLLVIEKLENVSKLEAIKIIQQETGVTVKSQESVRALSDGAFEIKAIVKNVTMTKIEKARCFLAHSHPRISTGELLGLAMEALCKDLDPTIRAKKLEAKRALKQAKLKARALKLSKLDERTVPEHSSVPFPSSTSLKPQSTVLEQSETQCATACHSDKPSTISERSQTPTAALQQPDGSFTVPEQSRNCRAHGEKKSARAAYISAGLRRYVWLRDQGKCSNCESTFAVQYEHIRPVAKGV